VRALLHPSSVSRTCTVASWSAAAASWSRRSLTGLGRRAVHGGERLPVARSPSVSARRQLANGVRSRVARLRELRERRREARTSSPATARGVVAHDLERGDRCPPAAGPPRARALAPRPRGSGPSRTPRRPARRGRRRAPASCLRRSAAASETCASACAARRACKGGGGGSREGQGSSGSAWKVLSLRTHTSSIAPPPPLHTRTHLQVRERRSHLGALRAPGPPPTRAVRGRRRPRCLAPQPWHARPRRRAQTPASP